MKKISVNSVFFRTVQQHNAETEEPYFKNCVSSQQCIWPK